MRTLDLGADKLPLFPTPDDERNPFLGLRSIRLALKHVDLFRTAVAGDAPRAWPATCGSCSR